VAPQAQVQLPASSLWEIDDRRTRPVRHLTVNPLERAHKILLLRFPRGGWYSGYPNRMATMASARTHAQDPDIDAHTPLPGTPATPERDSPVGIAALGAYGRTDAYGHSKIDSQRYSTRDGASMSNWSEITTPEQQDEYNERRRAQRAAGQAADQPSTEESING